MNPVVIPCSGRGSRMFRYTRGAFPKVLARFRDHRTILDSQLEAFWDRSVYYVVGSTRDRDLVREFVDEFHPDANVTILVHETQDGSFGALRKAWTLSPELREAETFLALWSDLAVEPGSRTFDALELDPSEELAIFTQGSDGRFNFDHDGLRRCKYVDGNVIGAYLLSREFCKNTFTTNPLSGVDVDLMSLVRTVSPTRIRRVDLDEESPLTDLGDEVKFAESNARNERSLGRWFNSVEVSGDRVKKTATHEFGVSRILFERDYYSMIEESNDPELTSLFPRIFEDRLDGFTMELVDGPVVFDAVDELPAVAEAMRKLHRPHPTIRPPSTEDFNYAMWQEYVGKTRQRRESMRTLCAGVEEDSGLSFDRLVAIAESAIVTGKKPGVATLIHGDPNAENVVIERRSGKARFIDPKGTFGDLRYYGDPQYDWAKLIYGLTGFNDLDSDAPYGMVDYQEWTDDLEFHLRHLNTVLDDVVPLVPECVYGDFSNLIQTKHRIKVIVGLIWLSLPLFVKEDLNKSRVAFRMGLEILNEAFK